MTALGQAERDFDVVLVLSGGNSLGAFEADGRGQLGDGGRTPGDFRTHVVCANAVDEESIVDLRNEPACGDV